MSFRLLHFPNRVKFRSLHNISQENSHDVSAMGKPVTTALDWLSCTLCTRQKNIISHCMTYLYRNEIHKSASTGTNIKDYIQILLWLTSSGKILIYKFLLSISEDRLRIHDRVQNKKSKYIHNIFRLYNNYLKLLFFSF